MRRPTKNQKKAAEVHDGTKILTLNRAITVVKSISYTRFDASVDLAIRLGVDPKKSDQIVRGTAMLPHGNGKKQVILVLCTAEQEEEARQAGADYVGLDEYLKKIEGGWTDFDSIVTVPSVMAKVGRLGKILGPRGLMPNPKTGTVTPDVGKAVASIRSGKIEFKTDKYGIVHAGVGRCSFSDAHLQDNIKELVDSVVRLKPTTSKGTYIKTISLSSTMSPGITIDRDSIATS